MSEDKQREMTQNIVDKVLPQLTELLVEQIGARIDERFAGIVKKSDELLAQLHEQKDHSADLAKLLTDAKSQTKERLKDRGADAGAATKPVAITRSDARSVPKYRAAKAEAEERGVPLEIVEDE